MPKHTRIVAVRTFCVAALVAIGCESVCRAVDPATQSLPDGAAGPANAPQDGRPGLGLDVSRLHNPVLATKDNLRDPAVLKLKDGYLVFYSRVSGPWGKQESWSLGCVFTPDFVRFRDDHDVSPKGFASPDGPVWWHGRYVMASESYPVSPAHLFFSESPDGYKWSEPKLFLPEANALPWNGWKRGIDPTFVVDGDTLHCFFIGSAVHEDATGKKVRANLMGHAITHDADLSHWEILTPDQPLIGYSDRAPDGVENMVVVKNGTEWVMILSEGLAHQHLATASSTDLVHWKLEGPVEIEQQGWLKSKFGAPFVWRDGSRWMMILMGEGHGRTTLGLLTSDDLRHWKVLPEGK